MNLTSTVNITASSQIPVGHGKSGTEERKKNMLVEHAQISISFCTEGANILLINSGTESWWLDKTVLPLGYIYTTEAYRIKKYRRTPR